MAALVLVALAGVAAVVIWDQSSAERTATERAQRRQDERQREAEVQLDVLREDSAALVPEALGALWLGMTRAELMAVRPGLVPSTTARDPHRIWLEEELPSGARLLCALVHAGPSKLAEAAAGTRGRGGAEDALVAERLAEMQVMSTLPSRADVRGHLSAMHNRYGVPTGIWNCSAPGTGAPMRRFTWTRRKTAMSDIFLLYGDRVSVTMHITTDEGLGQSLAMGRCAPVGRDQLDVFPAATAEQIEQGKRLPLPASAGAP